MCMNQSHTWIPCSFALIINAKGKDMHDILYPYAKEQNVPLLFDTDMAQYAQIYQHFGCELYNQTTASNGVTRYNLVWKPQYDNE